jgi:hypothetical protein
MNAIGRWLVPAGVGMLLVLGLGWQRLLLEPARAEREVLRDRQRDLARLRAEGERLRRDQISDAELARWRADRAAIGRLRDEVSAVQTAAEVQQQARAARAAERFALGQRMASAEWRQAGAASPAAALETVLWAAAGGEVDVFAQRIQFDPAGRQAAQALWEGLAPAERARHASPAHLLAFLSIRDIPIGSATVESWGRATGMVQPVGVRLAGEGVKPRSVNLVFVRAGEEWKLHATAAAVAKYAAVLRGAGR